MPVNCFITKKSVLPIRWAEKPADWVVWYGPTWEVAGMDVVIKHGYSGSRLARRYDDCKQKFNCRAVPLPLADRQGRAA